MRKTVLILSMFVIAALAVAFFTVPAQALDKDRWVDEIDETWDNDGTCDFTLTVHQYGTFKSTLYMDNKGLAHYRGVDANYKQEMYAKDHPEKVIRFHFQGPDGWDDLVPDGSVWIYWLKGQWQRVNIPGYGVVRGRTGNLAVKFDCSVDPCIETVLKDVGLNTYDPEEIQIMCDYLRP